jgi:thiamine biosynthesis protein ThiS
MKKIKTFFLNGEEYLIDQKITLLDIINYFNYDQSLLVLEYNKFICPKKNWATLFLENKDIVEIVTIVGGG